MNMNPESMVSTNHTTSHQYITKMHIDDHQRSSSSSFAMVEATSSSYNSGNSRPSSDNEKDEDMANCLIMLAESVSPIKKNKLDHHKTDTLKIRRLNEITTTTTTTRPNSSFHNYECKTCNRAFSTFQALGGHRASHKKPKLRNEDTNSIAPMKLDLSEEDQMELVMADHEENKFIMRNNKFSYPASDVLQERHKNKTVKVHECSICGSEFFSGQALGGHMRRHRTIPPSTTQITAKSHVLSLDLNLPPPEVMEDVHSRIVFSAVSVVDCHY
ncbi:zinc finger protein ZAT5-like [Rutidosis leptorrhynchoides]|uniref:zinc finger protein ZAT5-like n=1 Tax=Rutidosis leptorrhynchoides TaxID=125765 RepID=UPI003A98EC04